MLSDKKLARIEKILDVDTRQEISAMDVEQMRARIAQGAGAIKQAEDELEANPKYQELKEMVKACTAGLSEVKKRQQAIIQYCLHTLEEKGSQ